MKNKRLLASMLCAVTVLSSLGVSTPVVHAEENTFTGDGVAGGIGNTLSDFTATADLLGGDIIVVVPDRVDLSKVDDNFTGTGTVTAYGATTPDASLSVSTDNKITYENQSDTNITVDASVEFGEAEGDVGVGFWTASELKANISADDKTGHDVTATVPVTDVAYIGTYATNIQFNIGMINETNYYTIHSADFEEYCGANLPYRYINIADEITKIDTMCFYSSNVKDVNIPESVTSIGGNAFAECYYLGTIEIPSSVTKIETCLFSGSIADTIIIPNSVTYIDWAGLGVGNVKNLYLGYNDSLTLADGEGVFDRATIENLYFEGTEEQWNVLIANQDMTEVTIKNIVFETTAP